VNTFDPELFAQALERAPEPTDPVALQGYVQGIRRAADLVRLAKAAFAKTHGPVVDILAERLDAFANQLEAEELPGNPTG
jgi:hypothetical protein